MGSNFRRSMENPRYSRKLDPTIGLATKVPKNGLKIFGFSSKTPIKTPKNLQKFYDILKKLGDLW